MIFFSKVADHIADPAAALKFVEDAEEFAKEEPQTYLVEEKFDDQKFQFDAKILICFVKIMFFHENIVRKSFFFSKISF